MVHDASSGGPERSVLVLHPHWKVLLWPVIFGVLVVAAAVAVLANIPAGASVGTERLVIAAVAVVLLLVGVLRPVLRWKTTTYELTTGRLRVREGILTGVAGISRWPGSPTCRSPVASSTGCSVLAA